MSIREVLRTLSLEELRQQISTNDYPAWIGQGRAVALEMLTEHLEAAARTGRTACHWEDVNAYPIAVDALNQRRWLYMQPGLYPYCMRGVTALTKEMMREVASQNGFALVTPVKASHGEWVREMLAQVIDNCPLVVA